MNSAILAPAAALVVWTLFILALLVITRMPALKKIGVDLGSAVGGRGQDLDGVLPDKTQWKTHNYIHLVEQPTLFYAVVFIAALTGTGDAQINVILAWAYVGLRIVHSLIQVFWNRVQARFMVFGLGTFCLLALAIHALLAALH